MIGRHRVAALLMLMAGIVIPQGGEIVMSVHAASNPIVWTLNQRAFNPASGRDTIPSTFTVHNPNYLVEIALSSSDAGDVVSAQLGDDARDATQVQSGEDRFFLATHLKSGSRPSFRLIPDPNHNYGGRTLKYAAQVMTLPALPLTADGTSVSNVPNLLGFQVARAGTYTVHYKLDSGSAHLAVISSGATKDSGKITGEGGFSVSLPAGPTALQVKQTPGGASMHWSLAIGVVPAVRGFSPANGANLATPPTTLSVIAGPGAKLLLDHQVVSAAYDRRSKRLTYRPARPLAAGEHVLGVEGADGTPGSAGSTFAILPPVDLQPPSTPAGTVDGEPWVKTTTPDGRYTLEKPASWVIVGAGGTVVLADPKGTQFIMLSERFLNTAVNAQDIAQKLESALADKMQVSDVRFGGSEARAAVATTVTGSNGAAMANLDVVLPNPERYSLLLVLGFDTTNSDTGLKILGAIEDSLQVNDEAGVLASRRWLHYRDSGLSLDYPEGWAANFGGTGGVWFAGPGDQAIMYAVGFTANGSVDGSQATSFGRQVVTLIQAKLHHDLKIVNEQSSNGVYRWLATFSTGNDKSVGIEYGQAVTANGMIQTMWGDTDLEQMPSNLPLFGRILNSAVQGARLSAPDAIDVAAAVRAIGADVPPAATQGQATTPPPSSDGAPGTPSSGPSTSGNTPAATAGSYINAYENVVSSGNDYTFMSNMMMDSWASDMNAINDFSDSSSYYEVTDSY